MWLFFQCRTPQQKNVALVIPTSCHALYITTLQSMMNVKLSQQRFRHCHENWLIKTIQTIPPIGECQVDFHLLWIKDYPNLQ